MNKALRLLTKQHARKAAQAHEASKLQWDLIRRQLRTGAAMPQPSFQAVAATGKGRLLSSAATHLIETVKLFGGILKPIGNFSLWTDKDGHSRLVTVDAAKSGEMEKVGIQVIDGDKPPDNAYWHKPTEHLPILEEADPEPDPT